MSSTTNVRYTTEGPLRGQCGHKHRDLESAADCLADDDAICAARGGHTDRKILVVERGTRRELNPEELALVQRYTAL